MFKQSFVYAFMNSPLDTARSASDSDNEPEELLQLSQSLSKYNISGSGGQYVLHCTED